MKRVGNTVAELQQSGLPNSPGKTQFTDIHCHLLGGFDDGPGDLSEACDLCESLVKDGIDTVIATPHTLGRFDGMHDAEAIRKAMDTKYE